MNTETNGKPINLEGSLRVGSAGSPDDIRVYSNVIPLRRDRHGNPVPRRHLYLRPLISLDPRALIETGEAFLRSPEAGARHLPWLKAKNAIAADENVRNTRSALEDGIARDNCRIEHALNKLSPTFDSWKAKEAEARATAAAALAGLPIAFTPDAPTLDFGPNEPMTLDEIAGHNGLPHPEAAGWWERKGYKILSAIGGGIVFGLSFGLLTEKVQLISLSRELPIMLLFAFIGITIMTVIEGIFPWLGKSVGGWLYRRGILTPWTSIAAFVCTVATLIGLVISIVMIESRVEQLGIFKGIAASSSIHGIQASRVDLVWVSLMLVVPIISCYIFLGLAEGERQANLVHLKGLLATMRTEVRLSAAFANAASLHQRMKYCIQERSRLEAEISEFKAGIRHELTQEERERLEDMEMDATAHSWATEDFMVAVAGKDSYADLGQHRVFQGVRRFFMPARKRR